MSNITGTVVEVGDFKRHTGAIVKTAFGTIAVGRRRECAIALAAHLYKEPVTIEVSDSDGRVLSVKPVTP